MSSLGFVLLGALAVIVGALIPVQAATNAAMSRVIGSVAITSLALFAIGFVVVAAWAIVIRVPSRRWKHCGTCNPTRPRTEI